MKSTLTTAVYVLLTLLFIYTLLFMVSCNKKGNDGNGGDIHQPNGSNCAATKAAAENARVFPADNPWNRNISTGVFADMGSNMNKRRA